MSWWQVNADTLAGSRFVTSPLAEAVACLKTLQCGSAAHVGERQWLEAHLPGYRDHLAGDPVTASLVGAALGHRWNATFLTPTPLAEDDPTFAQELEHIRSTPPAIARADLAESLNGSLPAMLYRDDLAQRAADLLEWVWTKTVQPYWPRRKRIIEADIVARTARLGLSGWEKDSACAGAVRHVPVCRELAAILKAETIRRDLRPDDAIFVLDDGRPLTAQVYRKAWRQARAAVLQAHEIASPLGRHVSALRDARIAAWLKNGDQTAAHTLAVAKCAGMSAPRLAERFAHCLRMPTRDEIPWDRLEAALALPDPPIEPIPTARRR
ncbi:hypothetical protein [Streptomyces sp. TM32]|uniref:hypothetical protein n=1 Tax=Streptomyces sp. TM32 TaxID=1652669 RepID=UPI0020B12ED8|nr:hypothetical protein [Streptomyces sp. TM32]